jgi:hypothetical protein
MNNDYDYLSQALKDEVVRIKSMTSVNEISIEGMKWMAKMPVFDFERLVKEVILSNEKFSEKFDDSIKTVIDLLELLTLEKIIESRENQRFALTERGRVITENLKF